MPNYNIEHMPTKANKRGALLYISNELKYKVRNNLQVHKDKKLESSFIEVISKSQKNAVVGCIYKHPKFAVTEFNECYLEPLLDKLSLDIKEVILMGDFNVDVFHHETHNQSRNFLDEAIACGNLTYSTSDHLAQFLIYTNNAVYIYIYIYIVIF